MPHCGRLPGFGDLVAAHKRWLFETILGSYVTDSTSF